MRKAPDYIVLRSSTTDELLAKTQQMNLEPAVELALIRSVLRLKQSHPRTKLENLLFIACKQLSLVSNFYVSS